MNILNLILTIILVALISLIVGYNAGKITGAKTATKGFEKMLDFAKGTILSGIPTDDLAKK